MRKKIEIWEIGKDDIEKRKEIEKFKEMRKGIKSEGGGFEKKVDIEVGSKGERKREDMGENRGIGRKVGKREERGEWRSKEGEKMLRIGMKKNCGRELIKS